jgi:ferredoxin-nitrite reductase
MTTPQHNALPHVDANAAFSDEQTQFLQGFAAGRASRAARLAPSHLPAPGAVIDAADDVLSLQRAAQARVLSAGGKLVAEEEFKRQRNPFDLWDDMQRWAAEGRFPKGTEVFGMKFHGLFYVAPAQNAFMCRLRIPNGILSAAQWRGVAALAQQFAGGYADITTRANLQLREIAPSHTIDVLSGLVDIGLTSRGSGADNIRNITGGPTAGIDPQELFDTRALGRALHHLILNHRELYGLPRKFNIAFDGGGQVAALQDTNDIGFSAVRERQSGQIGFRVALGGITGHGDFARDLGVLITPAQCLDVAQAVLKVFIQHGDRTDRRRARMKYVIDAHGLDWTLQQVEALLPQPLRRVPLAECEPRPPQRRDAHVGVHTQRQPGLVWLGVPVPAARLQVAQMHGIADIAERFGSGTLRLTVWQNLLISDVPQARVAEARTALQALGLDCEAGPVRAGMVACTGNQGCKFAAADTKRHAQQIIDWLEPALSGPAVFELALSASASEPVPAVPRVPLAMDTPINIHLTGCHHSCAQHYIGDIGLLAAKVPLLAEGVDAEAGTEVVTEVDTEIDNEVEGYHLYVGGGHGEAQAIAGSLLRDVPASHLPGVIESLLRCYLQQRRDASESFLQFSQRPGQGQGQGQGLGQGMQALRSALVDSHPALMARNQTGAAS